MKQLTEEQIATLVEMGCNISFVPPFASNINGDQTLTVHVISRSSFEASAVMVPPPVLNLSGLRSYVKMGETFEVTPDIIRDDFGDPNKVVTTVSVTGGPEGGYTVSDVFEYPIAVAYNLPGTYLVKITLEGEYATNTYEYPVECVFPMLSLAHMPKVIEGRVGQEYRLYGVFPDLYEGDDVSIEFLWKGVKKLNDVRIEGGALVFTPHTAGKTTIRLQISNRGGWSAHTITVKVAEAETQSSTDASGEGPQTTEIESSLPPAAVAADIPAVADSELVEESEIQPTSPRVEIQVEGAVIGLFEEAKIPVTLVWQGAAPAEYLVRVAAAESFIVLTEVDPDTNWVKVEGLNAGTANITYQVLHDNTVVGETSFGVTVYKRVIFIEDQPEVNIPANGVDVPVIIKPVPGPEVNEILVPSE